MVEEVFKYFLGWKSIYQVKENINIYLAKVIFAWSKKFQTH